MHGRNGIKKQNNMNCRHKMYTNVNGIVTDIGELANKVIIWVIKRGPLRVNLPVYYLS